MNDIEFFHQLSRQLYYYRNLSANIIKSRSYTFARNTRTAVKSPFLYAKKGAFLMMNNPRKLVQIATGKRTIQNIEADRKRLNNQYYAWIESVEAKELDAKQQKREIAGFKQKPLISLITPVWNPPLEAHNILIESVMQQSYENFELMLFNFSTKPEVGQLLDDWAAKDKRIVVKHGLTNEGISHNSNFCLESARGEFVGLLDHDDELMPHALYKCVKVINEQNADFVYSDKDKISEGGKRFEPLFKPDWSPEMALGGNYMTHFNLMRTSIVRELGAWDPATDGAQDWDLFLRITEVTDKIAHVPGVLYHWRTVAGSTANSIADKPYAMAAQARAVGKHLAARKLKGRPFHSPDGQMYIRWPLAAGKRLFVIHAQYKDTGGIEKLLHAITLQPDFSGGSRCIVLHQPDDFEEKDIKKIHEAYDKTEFVTFEPGMMARQLAAEAAKDSYEAVVFLVDSVTGNDQSLLPDVHWISQLTGWLTIPDVRIAGGAAYAENGVPVDIGSFFDAPTRQFRKYCFGAGFRSGYNGYLQWIRNLVLVSERLFAFDPALLRSTKFNPAKTKDHEFAKMLALAARAEGGRSVYDPLVKSIDKASFEITLPLSAELTDCIERYSPELLERDPYYNPYLDQNYGDPMPAINAPRNVSGSYTMQSF